MPDARCETLNEAMQSVSQCKLVEEAMGTLGHASYVNVIRYHLNLHVDTRGSSAFPGAARYAHILHIEIIVFPCLFNVIPKIPMANRSKHCRSSRVSITRSRQQS